MPEAELVFSATVTEEEPEQTGKTIPRRAVQAVAFLGVGGGSHKQQERALRYCVHFQHLAACDRLFDFEHHSNYSQFHSGISPKGLQQHLFRCSRQSRQR